MKRHMKRLAAPKTWPIHKKGKGRFIKRPEPRAPFEISLPLAVILRDLLGIAYNNKEAEYLIRNKKVLVNKKARKNGKFLVTLFDVITLPQIDKNYRLSIGRNGKLKIYEINNDKSDKKIVKIVKKQVVNRGKIQLTGLDSTNILVDNTDLKVGDSVVYNFKDRKIERELPLKEGAYVFFYKGSHIGNHGIIKEIKFNKDAFKKEVFVETPDGEINTIIDNLIVVGEDKPLIAIE